MFYIESWKLYLVGIVLIMALSQPNPGIRLTAIQHPSTTNRSLTNRSTFSMEGASSGSSTCPYRDGTSACNYRYLGRHLCSSNYQTLYHGPAFEHGVSVSECVFQVQVLPSSQTQVHRSRNFDFARPSNLKYIICKQKQTVTQRGLPP